MSRRGYLRLGIESVVPRPTLRLVQRLEAQPRPRHEDEPVFVTDLAEAKRVTRLLATLFAQAALNEPIDVKKLGLTEEDLAAIADRIGRARAAELMGLRWTPDGGLEPDPSAEKSITATTEKQTTAVVEKALAPGEEIPGEDDMALAIAGIFAFSESRADVVADYETGSLQNLLAIDAYEAAGVTQVLVSDGLETDPECILADGAVWSLAQARANLKQHPGCVRAFKPLGLAQIRLAASANRFHSVALGAVRRVPISSLTIHRDSLEAAKRDVARGGHPKTPGPVSVFDDGSGVLVLVNGHHRVAEALARGETEIDADVTTPREYVGPTPEGNP